MLTHLKTYGRMIQYIQSNYFSKGPTLVDIELSNRCNLKCKMCWFHGENGIGNRHEKSEMTTAEIVELLNQLAVYRPRIYFGGGEPFIREDFITIMAHAKSLALPISFTTNGTLLNQEKIEQVVALGIDHINISIDGPEELHDKLRGRGNFGKTISNVQHLLDCKKKGNIRKPLITVNITINPLVVGHLKETIDLIRRATHDEVDHFRIHHLWFITRSELKVHRAEIHKALERSAPGAGAHCIPLSHHIDPVALSDEISQLHDVEKIIFSPNLQRNEIREYYSESYQLGKRCMASFRAALVKPNGDIKFCPDEWIDDYVLGNIRDDRFEDIWNNKRARHFRSVIFWKKSFQGCNRCNWMHNFT